MASKWLDSEVRVTVTDGREFTGNLQCVDGMRNLILYYAKETSSLGTRNVGMLMIPGPHVVKFETHADASDPEDDTDAGDG